MQLQMNRVSHACNKHIRELLFTSCFSILLTLLLVPFGAHASQLRDDPLTAFDFLLLGLNVHPEPEVQVVPRNTATGISVSMSFSTTSVDPTALLSLLPSGIEVAAELVGPGIDDPVELRGVPGELLPIPPMERRGIYLVRDIRLERNGEVFLRAIPDTATVEVIDRILITQVTTRPLTLEEIQQKGILFGDENFSGFNFTLSLNLESRPVQIEFPVIFDSNDVPIPTRSGAHLQIAGETFPLPNAGYVPVMMKPVDGGGEAIEIPPEFGDVRIPGLIVFPGDVGFLNQFFSALLIVSNGAPNGSGLSVRALSATITLPPGEDGVPGAAGNPGDDPLAIAETETGYAFTLPVLGLGLDGQPGTGDDADVFEPGEQGQAEFLLEGRKEGFHAITFDIRGTLEGLPVGPVDIIGEARGGVLVKNPYFHMTFSAPATVRAGEEFSLYVTVTNISESDANYVYVNLDTAQLSGATLVPGEESRKSVETLQPDDSVVLKYRFRSSQTGQVTASYLEFDENGEPSSGDLRFHLGVGERGVPLSPDTLVLPNAAQALPEEALRASLRTLGQAWSVATAPSGTLPANIERISRGVVLDRATEIAEAGLRIQLGETTESSIERLAFGWASYEEAGFEQLLRETEAGRGFFNAIGLALSPLGDIGQVHEELAETFSSLPPHILIAVGSGSEPAPVEWQVEDAAGLRHLFGDSSELTHSAFLPLYDIEDPGRAVTLLTQLSSSLYEMSWTGTGSGALDLSVSLPRPGGSIGLHTFPSVPVDPGVTGKVEIDLLDVSPPLILSIDRDGDGLYEETVESGSEQIITSAAPQLMAATVIGPETLTNADPWGRVVALIFDREMREVEAENASNYTVEANDVVSANLQLSGRLVFLFLNSPVGEFIPRDVVATGLFDNTGRPLGSSARNITSRIEDAGAIVSGRVLQADGMPVVGGQVLYINTAVSPTGGRMPVGISSKEVAGDGSYVFDFVRQSPAGSFSIQATDPETGGFQELTTRVNTNGEHIVVDLVMRGRGGVTGTVTNLSGTPVAGAQVLVTSAADTASYGLAETDANGTYVVTNVVVGPVTVRAVSGANSGVAFGNIQRAGTFASVDVAINEGTGRVSGFVYDFDGIDVRLPVPQIEVLYLYSPDNNPNEYVAASTETAIDGSYSFEGMPTGDFRILAIDRVRSRTTTETGALVDGSFIQNFDLFFLTTSLGSIEAHVQIATGAPASGAVVTAAGRQGVTDADGDVTFTAVPPGPYTITTHPGDANRSVSTTVVVYENQVTEVNLTFPGYGQVFVTVLDNSGQPIPGQQVLRAQGCLGEEAVTDGGGVAPFNNVPTGFHTFKATRDGDLVQGLSRVQREGDARSLTLRFAGFGTVTGRVLDPDGQPVSGADVTLGARRLEASSCTMVHAPHARQIQTAADGAFVFDHVPIGTVSVSASHADYRAEASASDRLLLHGDSRGFDLTLTDNIAGELSGTMFLPDGETPAGPGVTVSTSRPDGREVTVQTTADGTFVFPEILPAVNHTLYVLTASDPVSGLSAQKKVYLRADQDMSVDLRLLGQGTVEVTVLDGGGEPVEEAFVELEGADFPHDHAAATLQAWDQGVVRFERINEGVFTVTATDNSGRGGRAEGSLTAHGATAQVTVSLTVTGTVTGHFVSSDGSEPIPNAEVRLRQATTGRLLGSTTTSSQADDPGYFEFAHVPAGAVLVTATDPLTGRIGESSGKIESEGQEVYLEIRQLGAGQISGIVTSGGVPITGAPVDLVSTTGLSSSVANLRATATAADGGAFRFDGIPVGSFTLTARSAGLTGSFTGAIEEDGQEIADIEVALQPSGTVYGTTYRPDGTTWVPGADMTLRTARSTSRTHTSADGEYRLEYVPTGAVTIRADESGGADAGIAEGMLTEGQELEIDVIFNGTGTVEGSALDSEGTPLSSSYFIDHPEPSNPLVRLTAPPPFARSLTTALASDGSFRFLFVPVGQFTLSLSVTGTPLYGAALGTVASDGQAVNIDVHLAESGSVIGRVLRPDGATPAPNAIVTVTGSGFSLTDLTDAGGNFHVRGIPLVDFTVRVEDPFTLGMATTSGAIAANGETVDVGDLVLDNSPIAVESIVPAEGATLAPPDAPIVVRFTDPVVSNTLSGRYDVRSGGSTVVVSSSLSTDGLELTLTPSPWLPPRSDVEVWLSAAIKDTMGRTLGTDVLSTFSTGSAVVEGFVYSGSNPAPDVDMTLTVASTPQTAETDGTGYFRFENVPVGMTVLQANDPVMGLAASKVFVVDSSDGVIRFLDANSWLVLAYTGNVTGQIFRADGSPAGAGLDVVVTQVGSSVGYATTDVSGSYLISSVPLGDFTVNVTDPATGNRGRSSGNLTQAGATAQVDVQLAGVGAVRVYVKNTMEEPVSGATATLRVFTRFGTTTTYQSPASEPDGSLLFVNVLADPFSVEAEDPVTGLKGSASGTVDPDIEVSVDVVLQPSGTITGTVFATDGATPFPGAVVKLYRESGSWMKATEATGPNGDFRFDVVVVSDNPHRIDVVVDDRLRARRRGIEVPVDAEIAVDIALGGLGTVTGQVLPPSGEILSSYVRVDLTSLSSDIGGFFSDHEASDGTYTIENVPVGAFRLSAHDDTAGFLGEAEGSVATDGETVIVDIQLVDNALNLSSPKSLNDGNGLIYRIGKSGALSQGTNALFGASDWGGAHLEVTVEGTTTRFAGTDIGSQEEAGREIATAVEGIAGLNVQRKIFVPQKGYFARYLEVFENTTSETLGFSASVVSNINNGSGGAPLVRSSSNGDEVPDLADRWLVIDDGSNVDPFEVYNGLPTTAWILSGENTSLAPVALEFEENVGSSDGRLTVQYDVSILPGERVVVMHFLAQQLTVESGEEAAQRLVLVPPEALDGLSLDELADIANFDLPEDGTSPVEPLVPLDGIVTGTLYAHDGEHPISGVQVEYQSGHILFRRIRRSSPTGSSGEFGFASSPTLVIPRVEYTLSAEKSYGGSHAETTARGSFTGRASFGRSPESEVSASSATQNNPPANAFDGGVAAWYSASGDAANLGGTPTLELFIPTPVEVDEVHLDTYVGTNEIHRVRIELLGSAEEVLFTTEEDLPAPDRNLDLELDPAITGVQSVRMVSLQDQGSWVGVNELTVLGQTTFDLGSSVQDLVFEGTAALTGTTRKVGGEEVQSRLTLRLGAYSFTRDTNAEGSYYLAPLNPNVSPVEVTAQALWDNPFLEEVETVTLVADTTTTLDLTYAPTSHVSGRFLAGGGAPVVNLQVRVGTSTMTTTTDTNGSFAFPEIPSGNYALRIVYHNRVIYTPFTVSAPAPMVIPDITLPAFGTVDVTVLYDTQGGPAMPVAGARVRKRDALDTSFGTTLYTNASGQLTLTNVAGAFTLQITHPANASIVQETTGEVMTDGQVVPITHTLPAFGTITGTVRLADDSLALNAIVELGGGITPQSTSSHYSNGTFTFSNVEAFGPFTVVAHHPASNRGHITVESAGQLTGQGDSAVIDLSLPATGTVDVSVTEEDTTPISGADVSILDSFSTEDRVEGATNASGQRTITLVPQGSFTVRAEIDGNVIGEAGGEITGHNQVVEVTIVRPADATVEGTVFAADGQTPIPGTPVELRSEDGSSLLESTTTDGDGSYQFVDVLPPDDTATLRAIFFADDTITVETQVTATELGETLTADLELVVSVVKGRSTERDGSTAVADASVELWHEGTFDHGMTVTNDSGEFAFFNVPTGYLELVVEDSFGLTSYVATELTAGAYSLTQDLHLPDFGTVEGVVTDSSGVPLSNDVVVLRNANLRQGRSVSPEPDGSYRFERVALGSFTLVYDDWTDPYYPVPGSTTGWLTTLGETVQTDIVLPQSGTVIGQLLDVDGIPTEPGGEVTNLYIEALLSESDYGIYWRDGWIESDGSYRIENVPVGDLATTVYDYPYAGTNTGVVTAGTQTAIDVQLGTLPQVDLSLGVGNYQYLDRQGAIFVQDGTGSFGLAFAAVNTKFFSDLEHISVELAGRQLVLGPILTSGLQHTRKVFAPVGESWIRYAEIFDNPGPTDIEVTVSLTGEATADTTSSGDDRLDLSDRCFVDASGIAIVYGGSAGTILTPDAQRGESQHYELDWRRLAVPSGRRVILLHFAILTGDAVTAEAQAEALMDLTNPTAYSDLTTEERSQVVNFVIPQ